MHSDAKSAKIAKRKERDEEQQTTFSDMLREVESLGVILHVDNACFLAQSAGEVINSALKKTPRSFTNMH